MNIQELIKFLKIQKVDLNHFKISYYVPTIMIQEGQIKIEAFEIKFERGDKYE